MSRSGYSDDCENVGLWRGAVESAIKGARGQALLRDMLAALDALPHKRLISEELVRADGECCALGAVALAKRIDVVGVDPHDGETIASLFHIANAMAREIAFVNDEENSGRFDYELKRWVTETPEQRFERVRAWVVSNIKEPTT